MARFKFSNTVRIGSRQVSSGGPVYIIAEAGVNHNGDLTLAHELIEVAAAAEVDAVKFQLFNTDALIRPEVAKARYQVENGSSGLSQYQMLKGLEITIDQCRELKIHAQQLGLAFICTPFDEPSLAALSAMGLDALKISSTDLTNVTLLRQAAASGMPLILSTGMSDEIEVVQALQAVAPLCQQLVLLQCTSSYPAPLDQLNLRVMAHYLQQFGVLAGYSDHSVGIGASPYAVAAGAVMVEKHFTLDKNLPGPDHKASLAPTELREYVTTIRQIEQMLGDGIKRVEPCEQDNRQALQKCLVASVAIRRGEPFSSANLVARRTGGKGLPAGAVDQLLGRPATTDFAAGDIIHA